MVIVVLSAGAAPKRRATLRGDAASLQATTGRAFVTSVAPHRTLAVRTIGSSEGEGA
ncbi:hypothetical protein G3I40_39450 [Streptomyces sp. SID14478]|uniref:hypothetical protein n=1 Tax=Streptomyces sp. SID14478 TaxID=2706073 RepID=UPI0013E0D14D|nr:hypothetical protein [Streptomyces sp. SID14478]NEB81241.1 hypothetical protein [Streptomyces sp. SID14478]